MKMFIAACAGLLMATSCAFALEPPPSSAKKATIAELKSLIDGKNVEVVIFDLEAPITATLKWDWKKQSITGSALIDKKKKIKVNSKLSFDGDKACAVNGKSKPTCHSIYIEGNKFYEVRDDGNVHAVSEVK